MEWFTVLYESGFIPHTGSDQTVLKMEFVMSQDEEHFERAVYNVLDFIGDIGGLFDGLKWIGILFLGPFLSNN